MSDCLRNYYLKRLFSVQGIDENVYDLRSLFRLEKTECFLDGLPLLFARNEEEDEEDDEEIVMVELDFNFQIVNEEDGFLLVETCARDEKQLECTGSQTVSVTARSHNINCSVRKNGNGFDDFSFIRHLFVEQKRGLFLNKELFYIRQLFNDVANQQHWFDLLGKSFGLVRLFDEENFYEDRFVLFGLNHLFGGRNNLFEKEIGDDLNLTLLFEEGMSLLILYEKKL